MKKIKSVFFPFGNVYEGSDCTITYEDNSQEKTIADTFYKRCSERNLTKEEIAKIPDTSRITIYQPQNHNN